MSGTTIHAYNQHTHRGAFLRRAWDGVLVVLGVCILSGSALAGAQHERHTLVVRAAGPEIAALVSVSAPPKRLVALQANLTQVALAVNADGTDLWPCFGPDNPKCASVGDPVVPLPLGGSVLGFPFYTWQLADGSKNADGVGCDALLNGTTGPGPSHQQYRPCAQLATWYQDDTFDSTDDLLQRVVVTQGERVIYDSGTVDYGPAGPGVPYPVSVILNTDVNFGFWPGAETGPNNGNCSADSNYPLTSPQYPGIYVIQAGQTCAEPVAGPAKFTTWTALATPAYTEVAGDACTTRGVASPCYTVRWTRQYEIHQDFEIFLQ